ncbi:MAG: hypothetical protein M3380_01445 [Chloroflexota bacterium]|nr:hypothetical protein [Chloroflexota bacterium]
MQQIAKPKALLAARTSAEVLFELLRAWFDVPDHITLDLQAVDSAVEELGDPQLVMAMAMRKLQAFHLLTTPGVVTTTDVVLTVIQDLNRALLQAPNMHLKNTAAETDWDAALVALEQHSQAGTEDSEPVRSPDDDEIEAFRRHHAALHEAARAVLHASDGQICLLV